MRRSTNYILVHLLIIGSVVFAPCFSMAAADSAEADFTPWSGWWWPKNSGGLATGIGYRGHPSPIEKYELLKEGSYPGQATQFELDNYYDPLAPSWYGHCGSWAAASVYEHIEFYPSSIDNIVFYVGDKKGLLTACHQIDVKEYGDPNDPAVFHWWLLHYIKDNGVDFYAELDPSPQVWNYPVFKYEMDIIEDSDLSHVVCTIWYVDDQVDPDIQGAVMKAITYTYTLFKYGSEITGGEWTGSSVLNRPEQLVLPILQGTDNTYLDYDFIRDLAVSRDDYLESDQPVELPPGGYNLILINEDIYTISCDVGDEVLLSFEKTDDLEEGIQVSVTDGNGAPVFSGIVEATEEVNFTADNPPYTIALSRNDFGGGGVYRLECDLKMAFEFANTKIQKGFGWGGFAITNTRETDCDKVFLVGYTEDGRPMETYIGPISLQPGEKRTVLISDLEVRSVEKNDLFGVKVHAPLDLSVISLTGYFEGNMSCYNGMERRSLLIIPDISSWLDFSRSVSWGLYNPITATSSVQMRLFSSEGVLKDEAGLFIPANSSLHYNSSISPFSGYGDGGWILVEGDGTPGLKGYVEWLENGIYKAEALYPLKPGTDFFMPVTAIETVPWGAKVTLINVADVVNEVAFMLIGGGGINEALVSFNPGEKKVLNMEELFSPVDLQTISESSLRIHSSLDAAGFYILETSADDAYFPLLNYENVSQELVLPHVSSDDYWWTAVNLANASSRPVGFSILPYDEYGEPMEEHSIKRLIMPRRKRIFDVSRLFGSVAGEISFVKFRTWMGPGIAGVFVYGNHDYSMLSGGVLKSPMPPHPGPLPQRGEGIN